MRAWITLPLLCLFCGACARTPPQASEDPQSVVRAWHACVVAETRRFAPRAQNIVQLAMTADDNCRYYEERLQALMTRKPGYSRHYVQDFVACSSRQAADLALDAARFEFAHR